MTTENIENTEVQEPKWFIDEGLPGMGDRPSWLPDKYKTVAELARSNAELEKKLGTAPDKYDFSKSRYLDPEFAQFKELQSLAKEKRVPQEVMDKFLESVDKYVDGLTPNMEDEIKSLGDNGKERVDILDNWAKANLSKEGYEAISKSIDNAGTIKALEELRGKFMSNTAQVPGNNGNVANSASVDDIKIELTNNLQKYKDNPDYRKDIQKRLEVAAKNTTGYIDKIGA